MSDFTARVHEAVLRVPPGRVASYGVIAELAGRPGAARATGAVLRALPQDSAVPWWRVLRSTGELAIPRAGHGRSLQRTLLEEEGVPVDDGRVDMARFGWPNQPSKP